MIANTHKSDLAAAFFLSTVMDLKKNRVGQQGMRQSWREAWGWGYGWETLILYSLFGPYVAYFLNDPFPSFSFSVFSGEHQQAMFRWVRGRPNHFDGQTQ